MDIYEQLQTQYDTFTKAQRRIADFILRQPESSCFLSLRDLAAQANVAEVTILNFATKLGYPSFLQFKKAQQNTVRGWISPNSRIRSSITSIPNHNDLFTRVSAKEIQGLQDTYQEMNCESTVFAARMLKKARNVYIFSHELSRSVGLFAEHRFRQLGLDVRSVDMSRITDVSRQLCHITMEDVVLSFCLPEYAVVNTNLPAVQFLCEKNIPIIILANRYLPVSSSTSTVTLLCSAEDTIFFNSITAAISVINMLSSMLALEVRDSYELFEKDANDIFDRLHSSMQAACVSKSP